MENELVAFLPAHIQNTLHPGEAGEILLVSSAGIYLKFEERILLLCDKSWDILPIGIGVEDFEQTMRILRPQKGQQVTVLENALTFQSGSIRLVCREQYDTACDLLPQPCLIRRAAEELAALRKERGISMLVLPLVLGRAPEQQKLNPHCAYGYHYFSNLMKALCDHDDDKIRSCVEKLLGLGPGLTPSADDCLLGMIFVFRALPHKAPAGAELFQQSIALACGYCTSQISAAYLKAVIAGAPFARMEQVFRGLCGEQPLDIQKLIQIGSSSGSEMLLGMLIALRVCGYDVSQKEELQ